MSKVCYQYAQEGNCSYGELCKFPHVSNPDGVGPNRGGRAGVRANVGKKKRNQGRPRRRGQNENTYLEDFFAQYLSFDYNPSEPVMAQFYAMCDQLGWERDDDKRQEAHDGLKNAMVQQFNGIYGTNENDLQSWRNLCQILSVSPVPNELFACRDAVKAVHVNIVDLVDIGGDVEESITLFSSEESLADYTRASGKFFPRDNAYAGGLLRFLLRHIMNPRKDGAGGRQGGRTGRGHRGRGTR